MPEVGITAIVDGGKAYNHTAVVVEMTRHRGKPIRRSRATVSVDKHHNIVFCRLNAEHCRQLSQRHVAISVGDKRKAQVRKFHSQERHRVVDVRCRIGIDNNHLEFAIALIHNGMHTFLQTLSILAVGKYDNRYRRLFGDIIGRKPFAFQPIGKTKFAPQRVDALHNNEQDDSAKPAQLS